MEITIHKQKGFTLIELLTVITIIALLMAVSTPSLQFALRQAKAVKCQANLYQWNLCFSMYTEDYDGRFFPWLPPQYADVANGLEARSCVSWPYTMRAYYRDCNDMLFCPTAVKYKSGSLVGDKFSAWVQIVPTPGGRTKAIGSYGLNAWIGNAEDQSSMLSDPPMMWSTCHVEGVSNIPVLFDCIWVSTWPQSPTQPPPDHEGCLVHDTEAGWPGLGYVCINRHDSRINNLFMDWSVRKVGLKELWTLKWNHEYDTTGPWTKAGGVQPSDWPEWMRKFKDY
ncbi:MAG: type II secretion system protein [Planctomycetes bacterium]|nr:type II secretion system protein [Planctomycetota bacterium]